MKRDFLPLLARIIVIFFIFALIVYLSLFFSNLLLKRQATDDSFLPSSSVSAPTAEPTDQLSRLEFADGQQMSSDNFNLQATDGDLPSALYLPVRTLTDFATSSATLAHVKTNLGTFTIQLFPAQAPLSTANFVSLVESDFYDGLKFHRLEPNFVAQTGDPASRDASDAAALKLLGSGYPGYRLADEISPALSHDQAGVVSFANININGRYPNTSGSQFFITLAPATYLDGYYNTFGQVTDGLDIVKQLTLGTTIQDITLE